MPRRTIPILTAIVFAALVAPARAQDSDAEAQRLDANIRRAQAALEAKDYDAAVKIYDQVLADIEKLPLDDVVKDQVRQIAHYNTACAFSLKGEKEAALGAFEKALAAGFDEFDHIERDTDLDPIRGEARFKEAIAKHQKKADAARAEAAKSAAARIVKEISAEALFPFDFDLKTIDGKPLRLADLKGNVVLVDLWGTWCPPCRAEIPHLVELHAALRDRGFEIVGLNWERVKDPKPVVERFVKENGITYSCALIDDAFLEKVPDFQGFPTLLIVDREGKVRLKKVGYTEGVVLRAAVEKLLEEEAPAAAPAGEGTERQVF